MGLMSPKENKVVLKQNGGCDQRWQPNLSQEAPKRRPTKSKRKSSQQVEYEDQSRTVRSNDLNWSTRMDGD